jgi:hypothetical protein
MVATPKMKDASESIRQEYFFHGRGNPVGLPILWAAQRANPTFLPGKNFSYGEFLFYLALGWALS